MQRVLVVMVPLSLALSLGATACHGKSDDDDDDKVPAAPAPKAKAGASAASTDPVKGAAVTQAASSGEAASAATPAAAEPASLDNGVVYKAGAKPEWVKIPGGKFHFGCEKQDKECAPNEIPGTEETAPKFEIMKTEVTVEQYAACVTAKKCDAPKPGAGGACNWQVAGREKHPVNCVTQEEATAYCTFAGGKLPTGIQWESACKGGSSRIYPWGDERPDQKRAMWGQLPRMTAAVGTHPTGATKQGLLDMSGNVWEWTSDAADEMMEVRGGAFSTQAYTLHCSRRGRRPATDRDDWIGIRCVK